VSKKCVITPFMSTLNLYFTWDAIQHHDMLFSFGA